MELAEEEALVHTNKKREARHRIRQDRVQSVRCQAAFLAARLPSIKAFLPPKVVRALQLLRASQSSEASGGPAVEEHVTASPPFVEGSMRDYQLTGLNWMATLFDNGTGGILGDEMGLGKTLQTIAFLGYLQQVRGVCGPHLIVCPLPLLGNWMAECQRWCPSLRAVQFYGPPAEREKQRETCLREHFDVCVTTYETVVAEEGMLSTRLFRYVILDEAQKIKSRTSKISQALRRVPCQHRLLLTGTPLQNNVHELWSLLNFVFPLHFTSAECFDQCFDLGQNVVDVGKL